MNRNLPFLMLCIVGVPTTTMSGCGPSDDDPPLEPSDAELADTIDRYCTLVAPCYPEGMGWEEPEYDNCVAQQEEWASRSPACREARYDYCRCIVETFEIVDSCEALDGQPCRLEANNSGALSCEISQ